MALIPWRPFRDLDRFFEDEDWMPGMSRGRGMMARMMAEPAMDLYETDKEVVAEFNLPDIDPDKIDISITDQVLRVSSEMEEEKEEEGEGKGYWRKEIRRRSFERAIRLPSDVDENKTNAAYENGVLKIVMPKTEAPKTEQKKIQIKRK